MSSSSVEARVATSALVVALVAMLITSAQLLAQIIATAEGARKCSKSVLGPWYNSTKPNTKTVWKRNWREGRLETRFTVPEISLTTSVRWINRVLYDPDAQINNRDKWRQNGQWHEDEKFPSTKVTTNQSKPVSEECMKPTTLLSRLFYFFRPSSRPTPADCLLGGSHDLDSLLFHPDYDERAPDAVGWINFLAFLRVQMEFSAKTEVIAQRWWNRYPAKRVYDDSHRRLDSKRIAMNTISWPNIRFIQHSWDFVPPDVTKPLASSTVGDIAIIIRRTGMLWTSFEPHKGIMNAEGGPHVINSSEQKGLGIVLQYRCLDSSLTEHVKALRLAAAGSSIGVRLGTGPGLQEQKSVPRHEQRASRRRFGLVKRDHEQPDVDEEKPDHHSVDARKDASGINSLDDSESESNANSPWPSHHYLSYTSLDKTFFGLVPSDLALNVQDFKHRTKEDCWKELKMLNIDSGKSNLAYDHLKQHSWQGRYEFNELLLMVPEAWRQHGKPRVKYRVKGYSVSVLYWTRNHFAKLAKRYLSGEEFIERIRDDDEDRPKTYHDESEMSKKLPGRKQPPTSEMQFVLDSMEMLNTSAQREQEDQIAYLEDVHNRHEHTTRYFVSISERITFLAILRIHFSSSIWAAHQARTDIRKHKHCGIFPKSEGHPWRPRNIELYFCYIPRYVRMMKEGIGETRCEDEELVIEAWLMLMTRAFLFQEMHTTVNEFKGEYLPTEFYGSRLPVWLA